MDRGVWRATVHGSAESDMTECTHVRAHTQHTHHMHYKWLNGCACKESTCYAGPRLEYKTTFLNGFWYLLIFFLGIHLTFWKTTATCCIQNFYEGHSQKNASLKLPPNLYQQSTMVFISLQLQHGTPSHSTYTCIILLPSKPTQMLMPDHLHTRTCNIWLIIISAYFSCIII